MGDSNQAAKDEIVKDIKLAVSKGVIFEDPAARSFGSAMVFYKLGEGIYVSDSAIPGPGTYQFSSDHIEGLLSRVDVKCNNRSGLGLDVNGSRCGTIDRAQLKELLGDDLFRRLFPVVDAVITNSLLPTKPPGPSR